MLERFGHGGDLLTAQELYGLPAGGFADFSANMNPFGPPPSVAGLLRRYADSIGRYPDPAVRGLRRKLADMHGVDEGCVLIGNGAAELIDLTVRLLRPAEIVLTAPCFAEYGDAARKCGIPQRFIPLDPGEQFRLTAEAVKETLERMRAAGAGPGSALWFLGSPNNPTGQLVEPAVIRWLLQEGERVAVDEAFIDFVEEPERYSLVNEASTDGRLAVIRSMTKFYAIPGIRLGYMIGTPEMIAMLRKLQVPWSVNSLAQQIGEAVLEETGYAANTMQWLAVERPWLTERLKELGLAVFEGRVNYVLFSIPGRFGLNAGQLQKELGAQGVLIRDASHFAGLDDSYCRIAVRFREENEMLLKGLKEVLHAAIGRDHS